MEKRNIQIDIDTARKWYLSRDSFKQELALQAFTKEELEEPELPKSWKEYCIKTTGDLLIAENNLTYSQDLHVLHQLLILRNMYRQGWKPDWSDDEAKKYCIFLDTEGILMVDGVYRIRQIFSFPTSELAEQFLENFKDELEQLKELL